MTLMPASGIRVLFWAVVGYRPKFRQISPTLSAPFCWGFAKNQTFRALGTRRPLIEETYMNKTLTALVAAATLAGSLAATATNASAQGRGFLPGLIVGGIVGGAIVGATQPRGYVVYPGYNAPLNGPGCYWTRQPVYDPYGNIVGWRGRPYQVCQ
jgi:hypothetical protein